MGILIWGRTVYLVKPLIIEFFLLGAMERRTLRPILPKLPSNQIGDKHQMRKPNLPGVFQILFDCPPHFGSEEQVEDRISSIVQKHEDYTLIGIPPKVNPSCASSVDDSLPLPVETEYGVPKAPTDDVFTKGHSGSKSQKPKLERTSKEEEKVEEREESQTRCILV